MPPTMYAVSGKAIAGTVTPINWSAQLAFVVVLVAAMQGTLGLESADPCRISFHKYRILLVLEAIEIGFAFASELISYFALRNALVTRLQWLAWVAPALLVVGILELVLEVWHTLTLAVRSRTHWQPLSAVGRHKNVDKWQAKASHWIETTSPFVLTGISVFLIGWRQRWWLNAPDVATEVSENRARGSGALSVGALVVCFVWGTMLIVVSLLGLVVVEFVFYITGSSSRKTGLFYLFPRSFHPAKHECLSGLWVRHRDDDPNCHITDMDKKIHHFLYGLEYGAEYDRDIMADNALDVSSYTAMTDEHKRKSISYSPPHMRNAIVGIFRRHMYSDFGTSSMLDHFIVVATEHLTILPLQICIFVGVLQMHRALDEATRDALGELVDAVVVVALVEVAISIKVLLWGYGHKEHTHNFDRAFGEESRAEKRTGGIIGGLRNRLHRVTQSSHQESLHRTSPTQSQSAERLPEQAVPGVSSGSFRAQYSAQAEAEVGEDVTQ